MALTKMKLNIEIEIKIGNLKTNSEFLLKFLRRPNPDAWHLFQTFIIYFCINQTGLKFKAIFGVHEA